MSGDRWIRFYDMVISRLDRWLLTLHEPAEIWGWRRRVRKAGRPVLHGPIIESGTCPTCRVEWPCARYLEIAERMPR